MLFIAEIGLNHNGNFSLAYELIKKAKYAGADIAKFQLGWRAQKGELNCIDDEIMQKLIAWANHFDIELMFSIITPEAYVMAQKYNFKRYKIASRTLKDNLPLVHEIVKSGKETIISLGMWDNQQLPVAKSKNIKYLWCKSLYPCDLTDMKNLPKDFRNTPYDGYSDHTIGIEMPLLAVARGAQIIEKHFTLDKSDTHIRDHALSATPEEFTAMVQLGREIHKSLQAGV